MNWDPLRVWVSGVPVRIRAHFQLRSFRPMNRDVPLVADFVMRSYEKFYVAQRFPWSVPCERSAMCVKSNYESHWIFMAIKG